MVPNPKQNLDEQFPFPIPSPPGRLRLSFGCSLGARRVADLEPVVRAAGAGEVGAGEVGEGSRAMGIGVWGFKA